MPQVSQYWPSGFWPQMNRCLLWLLSRQSGSIGNWQANAVYTQGATSYAQTPAATSGLVQCGIASQTNFANGVMASGAQGSPFPQYQIENIVFALPPGLFADNLLGPDGYPINESPQPLPWGTLLCNGYQVTEAMIAQVNYGVFDPNHTTIITPGNPQIGGVISKWQAGTAYSFGQLIVDGDGNTEMALVSGTTCASGIGNCSGQPPNWPTAPAGGADAALTGDNTQVWKLISTGYQLEWLALGYVFNLLHPLSYYRVDVFAYTDSFYYQGSSSLYPTALGGNALGGAATFSVANVRTGSVFASLYPAEVLAPATGWYGASIPAGWVAHTNMGIGYALSGYKAQVYVKTDIEYLQEDNIPILVQTDEFHARAGSSVAPASGTPTVHILYNDPVAGWTEVFSSLQTLAAFQELPRSFDVPPNDPLYTADPTITEGATLENRSFIYDAALAIIAYCGANNFGAAAKIINRINYFLDHPEYLATRILENGEDGSSASRWGKSNPGDSVADVNDPKQPPYGTGLAVNFHATAANGSFTYAGSELPDSPDTQIQWQHKESGAGFVFDVSVSTQNGRVTDVQVTGGAPQPATLIGTVILVGVGPGIGFYRTQLLDLQSLVSILAGDTLTAITGFRITLAAAGDLYFDNLSVGGLQPQNSLAFSYDVYNGVIDQAYVRTGAMAWVCYAYCVYMQSSLDFSSALYLERMFNFLLTLQSTASDQTNGLFTLGLGEYVDPGYQYIPGALANCSTEHNIDMWFACQRAALTLSAAATALLKTDQTTGAQAASLTTLGQQLAGISATIWDKASTVLYVPPESQPGHFAQGVSGAGLDTSEALDAAGTWGAIFAHTNGREDMALECLKFAYENFQLLNQQILKSPAANTYNQTYQQLTPFSGCKNYNDSRGGYSGSPLSVWMEGTWQFILALLRLYSIPGLASYFISQGTTVDAILSGLIAGQQTALQTTANGSLIGYSLAYRGLPYEFEVWPMLAPTAWMWLVSVNPSLLLTQVSAPSMLPYLLIPNGQNQSVRDVDGASSVGQFKIESIDPGGVLKALAAQANLLGEVAVLKMGFPGQYAGDFVPLHTIQISDVGFDTSGKVQISCGDLQRFFTGAVLWANGGPGEWLPGGPAAQQPIGRAWLPNAFQCSERNPRWLCGNPLDLYLAAMQNELGVGQDPALLPALSRAGNTEGLATANPFWQKYLPDDSSTLINPNNYLDVPGILTLRDGMFSGDWFEFKITSPVQAKSWLEEYLLKPLGLITIVRANGLLSLKSMKSPASQSPVVSLTQKNIIGIPQVAREPLINALVVRMDVNNDLQTTAARAYNSQAAFEQQTSIYQFRRISNQQVEATGLRTAYGGFLRAFLLADRVFRRYAFGTPRYQVKAFLSTLTAEIGDYVSLTHPLVPDLKTGQAGLTNVLCEIVGRQPNYARGTITFDLFDTRFMQLTAPFRIAPASAGTPGWSSASTAERMQYMFISSASAGGTNPDGSPGNTVF